MTYYILGLLNKYDHIEYDFDVIKDDFKPFREELTNNGYVFDYEDEGGFYFCHTDEESTSAIIRNFYIPDANVNSIERLQLQGLINFHDELTDILGIEAGDTCAVIKKVKELVQAHE